MAQDTTPAIVVYQGDGSNTVFSVPFDKGYYGEVKVLFVRRGLADYTYNPNTYTVSGRLYAWASGSAKVYTHTPNPAVGAPTYSSADVEQADTVSAIAGQTITVDSVVYSRAVQHDIMNNLLLTWTGTMLEVGDFICIARDTERGQPYEMPNNQKHIEKALDNLERQIQEVKDATDNALLVDPSHTIDSNKMDPIAWMQTILRSRDLSIRELRFINDQLCYSTADPESAEADKTWTPLPNAFGFTSLRYVENEIQGVRYRWLEMLKDGAWYPVSGDAAGTATEALEKAEQALEIAGEARDTAIDALGIANDANTKADQAIDYATQAQDAVANIYARRLVFRPEAGQTILQLDEDVSGKVIDLYWNGQLITQDGNWTVNGDQIILSFETETDDVIAVMIGTIRQAIEYVSLDAHNVNPNAHADLVASIIAQLDAHNVNPNAHANLNIDCGTIS